MTDEQQIIFDWIGMLPVVVSNWEKRLPMMYEEFNGKWFDGRLPKLSVSFICEFCDMSRDSAGIFIDAETAMLQSTANVIIRPGIRISSALMTLRDHVKIALIHEMIHASGIKGHDQPFTDELSRLVLAGAYNGLL
jgi:hypothetical protein